jgi:hypothetical protein
MVRIISRYSKKIKYSQRHLEPMDNVSQVVRKDEIFAFAKKLGDWAAGQQVEALDETERHLLSILVARADQLKDDTDDELIILEKSIEHFARDALIPFADKEKGKMLTDEEIDLYLQNEKNWIKAMRDKSGVQCYFWRRASTTPPKH